MKIELRYEHFPVCSGEYLKRALKRLGHDVRSTGAYPGAAIWGSYLSANDVRPPDHFPAGWEPDLVIVSDHRPDYAGDQFLRPGIPKVVYAIDNLTVPYDQSFDWYFYGHRGGASPAKKYGGRSTHLPVGFDPIHCTPSPIAWEDRQYDVGFVGMMYPQREIVIDLLRSAGLEVCAVQALVNEKASEAMHNFRITINVNILYELNQRVFEAAACGNVVVMPTCLDAMDWPPEHVVEVGDLKALPDKVKEILDNPPKLGYAWLREHTWDARCQVILDWYRDEWGGKA